MPAKHSVQNTWAGAWGMKLISPFTHSTRPNASTAVRAQRFLLRIPKFSKWPCACGDSASITLAFRLANGDLNQRFDIPVAGFNLAMNEIAATLGLEGLSHADEIVAHHRANGRYYQSALKEVPGVRLLKQLEGTHSGYWVYSLLADRRDNLIRKLVAARIGVQRLHLRDDSYACFGGAPSARSCRIRRGQYRYSVRLVGGSRRTGTHRRMHSMRVVNGHRCASGNTCRLERLIAELATIHIRRGAPNFVCTAVPRGVLLAERLQSVPI